MCLVVRLSSDKGIGLPPLFIEAYHRRTASVQQGTALCVAELFTMTQEEAFD